MPLRLAALVTELDREGLRVEVVGEGDPVLEGAAQDSRAVRKGDLFLAWAGTAFDANDAVEEAARAGAVAAVVERVTPGLSIPQLLVRDGRRAAALAAARVYGAPADALHLVGITGTNGKTTTALLTRALLSSAGPSAAIGTLGLVQPDGRVRPGTEALTTPGPVELARWMRALVDEGVRSVAMEVSSHALEQRRVDGLRFAAAVFTNLTQDHLDYHPTLEAYVAAKARLATLLRPDGWAVVNAAEPAFASVRSGARVRTFGCEVPADLTATDLALDATGSRFHLRWQGTSAAVHLPLLGRFNVENALGAAAVALLAGLDLADVATGLDAAPQVPGRLERVVDHPCPVLLDYAHTPDALDNVLETLRPLTRGRLIVLFGAGGDRDPGKRPRMAEAAARWADLVVVTSDNPRTEDPDAIIDQILPGIGTASYERITDRTAAIGRVLDLARPDDLVVLAGKGHEQYQVIGREKRPFDERALVLAHLGRAGA
ncbi:MAG: UDP-N-acetylmuramoyl-L-alanyl-D-glutamate--2,6-diaminopimelate ligase [Gemmatimonadota bacterium]